MPTFPTYRGELPACLSPFNPRHYLLLAYWIFFRPTALKCYLYQAEPEVYRSSDSSLKNLGPMVSIPAYRNLWLMMPVLVVVLSLPIVLLASWAQGTPVNWTDWAFGVVFSVVVGVVGGVVFMGMVGETFGVVSLGI